MLSSLFMLSTSGEVIIEKQFREKLPRTSLEDFWSTYVAPLKAIEEVPNVVQYSRYAFVQILRGNVVFLGITTQETPPFLIIEILNMIAKTLERYLKELSEDTLRENFSVVYQLLEELIDNGYPLTTEQHVLEDLVPPPTLENKVRQMLDAPKRGVSVHENSVPWRNPGIKYANNEIFFDVVEFMDVIIDAEGGIVKSSLRGAIECNCHLSGMPDVNVHLINKEIFEDVAYHRCVRHARYENDRSVSFVPPDGRFTLFQYRCKPIHALQPPFYVTPQITFNKEGGRVNVMVGLRHGGIGLDREKDIHKLTVHIPLPPQTDTVNVNSCSHGAHSFDNARKILTWRIGHLTSNSPSLSAEFGFGTNAVDDVVEATGESVTVEFQIPNYSASGVKVDTVSLVNENYKPYKGVKYMTKAGRFSIRTV